MIAIQIITTFFVTAFFVIKLILWQPVLFCLGVLALVVFWKLL